MNNKRVETVMTYDEWCKVHRKTLKKMVHDTVSIYAQWLAVLFITVGFPVGMIALVADRLLSYTPCQGLYKY